MRIKKEVFEKEVKYDGQIILKYTIEYPQIIEEKWIEGIKKFNAYNYQKARMLKSISEGELFKEAKETYEYNKKNGYPIMVYEVYSTFEITYNTEQMVSLYIDDYIYRGGAHGNTKRTSQTWDFRIGKIVPLKNFFVNNENYVSKIVTDINNFIGQDIANGNNIYFENYCCLTIQYFNVDNYYLQDGYIIIFYQEYDIAPYSSGILTFKISSEK